MADRYKTCVVFLLGYPGVGKRTVGSHLAEMLDGVLVDNQLINIPLLTLFKWDGKFLLPPEIWERVKPIREAVLGTIEDLAPRSNSYVFTNMLEDGGDAASEYNRIRSLAQRRGSLFMSVMLDCDVDEQVRRIDTPDRIARMKGLTRKGTGSTGTTPNCSNPHLKRCCISTRARSTPERTPRRSTRR